jgi:hypothetical protein
MMREQAELLQQRGRDDCEVEPSSRAEAKRVAKKFQRWKDGRFGKFGAASPVRRIDPVTGESREDER